MSAQPQPQPLTLLERAALEQARLESARVSLCAQMGACRAELSLVLERAAVGKNANGEPLSAAEMTALLLQRLELGKNFGALAPRLAKVTSDLEEATRQIHQLKEFAGALRRRQPVLERNRLEALEREREAARQLSVIEQLPQRTALQEAEARNALSIAQRERAQIEAELRALPARLEEIGPVE